MSQRSTGCFFRSQRSSGWLALSQRSTGRFFREPEKFWVACHEPGEFWVACQEPEEFWLVFQGPGELWEVSSGAAGAPVGDGVSHICFIVIASDLPNMGTAINDCAYMYSQREFRYMGSCLYHQCFCLCMEIQILWTQRICPLVYTE